MGATFHCVVIMAHAVICKMHTLVPIIAVCLSVVVFFFISSSIGSIIVVVLLKVFSSVATFNIIILY